MILRTCFERGQARERFSSCIAEDVNTRVVFQFKVTSSDIDCYLGCYDTNDCRKLERLLPFSFLSRTRLVFIAFFD